MTMHKHWRIVVRREATDSEIIYVYRAHPFYSERTIRNLMVDLFADLLRHGFEVEDVDPISYEQFVWIVQEHREICV